MISGAPGLREPSPGDFGPTRNLRPFDSDLGNLGGLAHRRALIIVDNIPPDAVSASPHDVARGAMHVHELAVRICSMNRPVEDNLGGVTADEYMADIGLQRNAKVHVVPEQG